MSAAERIARALGGAQREGRGWRCCCPVHGGHSLTIADGRGGRLLLKCWGNSCSSTEIFRELRRLRLSETPPGPSGAAVERAERAAWARAIWERARDARRSREVKRYLTSRGWPLPPPACLRWLPSCRHPSGARLPAMIARVDSCDGELIGIHRTYLTADCRRCDRASLGPIAGGAVRLAPAAKTIAIAEGIETALAIMLAAEIPTWAALSTSGPRNLVLPRIVETVCIGADNDGNGAGLAAAHAAAERWLAQSRGVRLAMPRRIGSDFNDVLLGERDDVQGQCTGTV